MNKITSDMQTVQCSSSQGRKWLSSVLGFDRSMFNVVDCVAVYGLNCSYSSIKEIGMRS